MNRRNVLAAMLGWVFSPLVKFCGAKAIAGEVPYHIKVIPVDGGAPCMLMWYDQSTREWVYYDEAGYEFGRTGESGAVALNAKGCRVKI